MDKIKSQILELFLSNVDLKFSEIEKQTKIRSNHLTYHLKELVKRGILKKEKEFYSLSESSESQIPYLSDKKSPLTVILILIGNSKQAFLHNRQKRPFKNYLSLPGGRLLAGESIKQATSRIMKDKFGINSKLKKINSVSLEHVKKDKKIIHSFLLILVSAETKEKILLTDITEHRSKIIKSDYELISKSANQEVRIETLLSKD